MNPAHLDLCGSVEWSAHLRDDILTPLLKDVNLGSRMLELGPGPGAATDFLRSRVESLTALELDPVAARELETKYAGSNVTVLIGDCVRPDIEDGSFDSIGAFTMLQDRKSTRLNSSHMS